MATAIANDYAAIRARRDELREIAAPRCPFIADRTLDACLRSIARCHPECPHAGDWIGPEREERAATMLGRAEALAAQGYRIDPATGVLTRAGPTADGG